jgi:hypothetical protein
VELGVERAGNGAVGRIAVSRLLWSSLMIGVFVVQGCGSVGGVTGAVVGAVSGSATANPAIGMAVGIGVKAGVDESINYVLRYWSNEEQMQIAAVVGEMSVGQKKAWSVRHKVPYDNKQGSVTVVRVFATPLTVCKEAVFSVDDPKAKPDHFVTTACREAIGWNWAVSEPAVLRWGALQ